MDTNDRKELVKIALFASQELEAAIKKLYPDLDPGEDLWSINFNLNNDAALLKIDRHNLGIQSQLNKKT